MLTRRIETSTRFSRRDVPRDTLDPVGVTFGTKTGQLWLSADEGDSWRLVTANLPEIWAVEAVVREH